MDRAIVFFLNFIFVLRLTAFALGAIDETTRLRLFLLGCAGLFLALSLVGLIRSSASQKLPFRDLSYCLGIDEIYESLGSLFRKRQIRATEC